MTINICSLGLFSLVQTPDLSLERKRENQRPVGKRSLSIATTRAPTRRQAAFEGLSNKECRRSSPKTITAILEMSSADFLPNPAKSFRFAEQSTCQVVSTRYRSNAVITS